jgi:uncharacterized protein (TIGR02453 family)
VPTFEGFTPDAIQFLADLAVNNDRAWFAPRKAEFERLLKAPLERLCEDLADRFAARGLPLVADPRRSPFRIYRDTRFARDKAPYKTNVGASFPWTSGDGGSGTWPADGARHSGGYFHFEPGGMYVGGGMYMPDKPRLDSFRRAVVDTPARVTEALEDPQFVAWFGGAHPHESLKRLPAGWPADHPMAPLFLWKDVIFGRPLADAEVCSPDLPDLLADGYAAAAPVFRLLATLE